MRKYCFLIIIIFVNVLSPDYSFALHDFKKTVLTFEEADSSKCLRTKLFFTDEVMMELIGCSRFSRICRDWYGDSLVLRFLENHELCRIILTIDRKGSIKKIAVGELRGDNIYEFVSSHIYEIMEEYCKRYKEIYFDTGTQCASVDKDLVAGQIVIFAGGSFPHQPEDRLMEYLEFLEQFEFKVPQICRE